MEQKTFSISSIKLMTTEYPPFYAVANVNLIVDRPEFKCASSLDMEVVLSYQENETISQIRERAFSETKKLIAEANGTIKDISLSEAESLVRNY